MIFEQFYLACLAHASYLVGDEASGEAAVVDPRRDVDVYLEDAARRGLTIRHVILTHFHADFVAGHLELARRTGATILYVYAERLSWGRGFVLHIEAAPPEVADADEVRAVAAVNRGVEACIRRSPAQYYWAYMRFRRRPAGEPPFYPW